MGYELITAPAVEPITLAEARSHLRATATDEDWLIQAWIVAVRKRVEHITWRKLITQTWDYFLDAFPSWGIEIPFGKLQSITSAKYIDTAGVEQTISSTLYQVDVKSDPGRLTPAYGETWPSAREQMNAVTIRFVCGYGLATAVPEDIKAAMFLILGHLHEHREDVADFQKFQVPNAAEALLSPYKIIRF